MPDSARDWKRSTAALVLIAVIVGFYWKLVFTDEYTWLSGNDPAELLLPWFQFQAAEWHEGRFPLWDPHHYGGQPMLGQANNGSAYPLNWVLFSLPLRDGHIDRLWLHWYYVVIHLMAAWFAYLLAREMGGSRRASVFGGVVYALAGWMGQNDWPQMLNGAVWAPLVLRFVLRAVQGKDVWRSALLGGFFLGVAWLSGHHQMPVLISLAAGGVWVWGIVKDWRKTGAGLAFFAIAFGTGALLILPALEYGKLAVRWAGAPEPSQWADKVPYGVHTRYAMPTAALMGFVLPGAFEHSDPFLSLTVLTLAVAGLTAWKRNFAIRAMALVGIGGLLFALADKSPLHGWLYALAPIVEKARHTSSAVVLLGLAAAVLGALGVDALLSRDFGLERQAATVLGAVGLGIAAYQVVQIQFNGAVSEGEDRTLLPALAALLLAALFAAWRRDAIPVRAMSVCLMGLFLLEAGNTASYYWPSKTDKERTATLRSLESHADIAAYLRKQNRLFRVDVDSEMVPYNFGDWAGVDQTAGYVPAITKKSYELEWSKPWIKRLMGVEYAIAREPQEFQKEAVFAGKAGPKVFRNMDVMPRAFLVHEAEQAADNVRLMIRMGQLGEAIGKRTVLLGTPPELERCEVSEGAAIREYTPSRIVINATAGCRGMLVLTDITYPGWEARVDGREARIWDAYGAVRGVLVEKGSHEVVFAFRPKTVYWGGLSSAVTALLVAGVWVLGRLRPPQQS